MIRTIGTWLLAGLVFLVGCSSTPDSGTGPDGGPESDMTLTIQTGKKTNEGRPFRLVVRAVANEDFLTDTYGAIATRAVDPNDASVLASATIFPGKTTKQVVQKPEKQAMGLYFLFTDPGDHWRCLIERPLPGKYEIKLGKDQIKSATQAQKKKN